ncbi:MAG: xanthine dehydrogenase family protein subunit M [Chloroflexota bacterium]|nr:xanthine dehydrogenase family protein subunit M [Chloroflexota bacterium]MDQ5866810.1 xanthine dehydrogenase family protein subunit M [Chloroflexota bacterium]
MKPTPFEYYAPRTRQEALELLAEYAGEAKVLAGGQSLVPSMNFRLAQPAILLDLNGVDDLFGITPAEGGGLLVGAMTRHRTVERSPIVAERAPLIAEAMPFIAHPQIRNRGTFGGSLAHADPAAELPALAVALDAQVRVQNVSGDRWIPASDFFLGLFTTALEPDEMLVEVEIPPLPGRTGTAFEEFARRHGDYALVGTAAVVTLGDDGTVAECKLVFLSVGDMPVVAASASEVLRGQQPSEEAIRAAAEALTAEIDPQADIHATAEYRMHLSKVLARRTLVRSVQRAKGNQ